MTSDCICIEGTCTTCNGHGCGDCDYSGKCDCGGYEASGRQAKGGGFYLWRRCTQCSGRFLHNTLSSSLRCAICRGDLHVPKVTLRLAREWGGDGD